MRKLLFRGQAVNESTYRKVGEWCEGYYVYNIVQNEHFIISKGFPQIKFQIDPNTLGQLMNLQDKNGKDIWEKDILVKNIKDYSAYDSWADDDPRWDIPINEQEYPLKEVGRDVATMNRFPRYWLENESFGYEGEDLELPQDWEIIGNIFDNSNLLNK